MKVRDEFRDGYDEGRGGYGQRGLYNRGLLFTGPAIAGGDSKDKQGEGREAQAQDGEGGKEGKRGEEAEAMKEKEEAEEMKDKEKADEAEEVEEEEEEREEDEGLVDSGAEDVGKAAASPSAFEGGVSVTAVGGEEEAMDWGEEDGEAGEAVEGEDTGRTRAKRSRTEMEGREAGDEE